MQKMNNKNTGRNSSKKISKKKSNILHLPEGLKIIKTVSFVGSKFQEVIIPYSVIEIQERAFRWCERLKKVKILNPDTKVAIGAFYQCENLKEIEYGNYHTSDTLFHLIGKPFLVQNIETLANLNHTNDPEFEKLTSRCAQGDANAMNDLSDWFEKWSKIANASLFYIRAANYWRYRSYRKGNKNASSGLSNIFLIIQCNN